MKKENIYCDYCQKLVSKEGEKLHDINGFYAEIGYSSGGWGRRRDIIKTTVEICDDCFKSVERISNELAMKVSSLKQRLKKLT